MVLYLDISINLQSDYVMKSWKIGAISGLIAGLVSSVVFSIIAKIGASNGLWEEDWQPLIINSFEPNILLGIIFGAILGIIYARIYKVVPGKNILKGLCFGLIIYLIFIVRIDTFWIGYNYWLNIFGDSISWPFTWIVYGIMLEIFYTNLLGYNLENEKRKIIEFDMKSGFFPGAIAGILGGLTASISAVLGSAFGIWRFPHYPEKITIDLILGQAGAHIFYNMIWGIIFGLLFTRVYMFIPDKRMKKGFYYGLVLYLITTLQLSAYWLGWILNSSAYSLIINTVVPVGVTGFFALIPYGIALGFLYKPPK